MKRFAILLLLICPLLYAPDEPSRDIYRNGMTLFRDGTSSGRNGLTLFDNSKPKPKKQPKKVKKGLSSTKKKQIQNKIRMRQIRALYRNNPMVAKVKLANPGQYAAKLLYNKRHRQTFYPNSNVYIAR